MLKAGFGRLDITPPFGAYLAGYPSVRLADGIRDPLLVTAIVFSDGVKTVAAITLDQIGIPYRTNLDARKTVAERCGLPVDAVLLACTHIHTGPTIGSGEEGFPENKQYNAYLFARMADAVNIAISDLKPAILRIGRSIAKDVSFIRRFRMKDGSTATNPGRHNPQIDRPIGNPDETVQVIRCERNGAKDIVLVNFQVHPDVVGGTMFSADFPGFVRNTLEGACDDILVAYFNGAQGDTNHINVNAPYWDKNGGYEHSRHMGRAIAGAVLQILEKCTPLEDGKVDFASIYVDVPLNVPDPSEIPWAEHVIRLFAEGREDELPKGAMSGPIAIYSARRIVELKNGPEKQAMYLNALRFGRCVITGAPGEPFTWIGSTVKDNSPFDMTFFCCCCNGYEGYLPVRSAFEEGGYEAKTSRFLPGVAELLAEGGTSVVNEVYSK